MLAEQLTRALERMAIPIAGVSIGHPTDRSQWRIEYLATATPAQKVLAEGVKLSFDPSNDPAFQDEQADSLVEGNKVAIALTLALWKQFLGRNPTGAERLALKLDAKAVWKTL